MLNFNFYEKHSNNTYKQQFIYQNQTFELKIETKRNIIVILINTYVTNPLGNI